jgi:hypothetical protein
MIQELRKTLVIICEGSVTEPNYFYGLASNINKMQGRPRVIIRPKPPLQTEEEKKSAEVEHQRAIAAGEIKLSGRKRRDVKFVDNEPEVTVIPDGYTAQPKNYVWQAQKELEIHDEAWAVFDLDGHPEHENAFNNAEQVIHDKTIDIAFSSVSFETWILLHFEYCNNAFQKSQCRTQDELHKCGQGIHEADCNGASCITGYMKMRNYIAKVDDVKKTSFESIEKMTFNAIINSLSLRDEHANPTDCYRYNPITTVDRLVFKLMNISDDYKWIRSVDLARHHIVHSQNEASILRLTLLNNSNASILIKPNHYQLANVENDKIQLFERRLLIPGESISVNINLNDLNHFNPKYLLLDNEDTTSDIIEIQCLNVYDIKCQ